MLKTFSSHVTRPLRTLSLVALLGSAAILTAPTSQAGPFSTVVQVNDRAVTQYEIDQRLRFMLLLQAPDATPQAVEAELINDRLKMDAARQLGIEVSSENMISGLAEFASRANMGTDEFVSALEAGGVSAETYRDFVHIGLAWREVIRQRVIPTVEISEGEVERAMKRILDTPQVTDVLISEIIMPAPEGSESTVMERAARISADTRSEAQFAAAARQYSASPSAEIGGRLEWLRVSDLPQGLDSILAALKPGQTTAPLQIPGAVVLFHLRDTRGTLRPGAKNEEVDYLTLTVDSTRTAANILADATSCDTFYAAAGSAAPAIQRQTVPTNALPTGIGVRMGSLDDNEGTVVDLGGGAQIIMLCKRQRSLLAAQPDLQDDDLPETVETGTEIPQDTGLPPIDSVRDNLFNEKVNDAADAYLAELRANAIIRRH